MVVVAPPNASCGYTNPISAAAAVATSATVTVALTGVLYRAFVLANQPGSTPSRPIAKSVRAAAVAQARQTMNAESMPPISMSVGKGPPTNLPATVLRANESAPAAAPLL